MGLFRKEILGDATIPNYNRLSLKDVEYMGYWELNCSYWNNEPQLQSCELALKPASFTLPSHFDNGRIVPIFDHESVSIPLKDNINAHDQHFASSATLQKVKVLGQSYFYHPLGSSNQALQEEIEDHVKIITSGLNYSDMRILPLRGIVVDDKKEVVGLLKEWHSIYDADFLGRVLRECIIDPDHLKSWVAQFDNAVSKICEADLDIEPKVENVAINKDGDLWIVYLRDGMVPDWHEALHYFLKCVECAGGSDDAITVSSFDDHDDASSEDDDDESSGDIDELMLV